VLQAFQSSAAFAALQRLLDTLPFMTVLHLKTLAEFQPNHKLATS
jgi:hypothetical protein